MTLIDSDILISVIRTRDPKLSGLLRSLPAVVSGVTRAELLQGARTPADRAAVMALLRTLRVALIPDIVWTAAGDNLASFRRRGLIVPFNDGVLATLAVTTNTTLWSRDKHYPMMQPHLPALRLFAEPP